MRKLIAIVMCWCLFSSASAQPNITAAEYFIDTDPGFGNATSIALTPSANIINNVFTVSLTTVTQGIHNLYIRSKDANGKWSITNRFLFYKSVVSAPTNIIKAEYFMDTDPGFGNAINIPITPGTDLQNVNFVADISALTPGIHSLYIRSLNADGKWSISNRKILFKAGNSGTVSNIVKAEYFFDTDPGFGNAIDIPLVAASDVQNINFSANISSLPEGVHNLYIRSRNADGRWSVTNRKILFRAHPINGLPPANITNVEYYIDNDPGFGNGVPVVVNPASNFSDFLTFVNISGLSVGNHKLYLRSKTNTRWSITNIFSFSISATAADPFINVNAITKTVMCARDTLKLSFDARGTFNAGNVFNAELSDASGSFASPVVIGSYAGINSAIISARIPDNTLGGTNYRVRVSSTNPVVTGLTGNDVLTIGNWPYLGPDTTVYHACLNETTNLNPLYNTTGLTATWNTGSPSIAPPGIYQLIVVNNYGCRDTALAIIKLEVATWTGAVSSDWHTAANWDIGKVPTDKTHVIIPGPTANPCVIGNGSAAAASVQARNGSNFQVINNRVLDIIGICPVLPPN